MSQALAGTELASIAAIVRRELPEGSLIPSGASDAEWERFIDIVCRATKIARKREQSQANQHLREFPTLRLASNGEGVLTQLIDTETGVNLAHRYAILNIDLRFGQGGDPPTLLVEIAAPLELEILRSP